jgi:hypothetical protein
MERELEVGDLIKFTDNCVAFEEIYQSAGSQQSFIQFNSQYCIEAGDFALVVSIKNNSNISALVGNKILAEISSENVHLIK